MISSKKNANSLSSNYKEAFVWIWLPNETEPVVAGRLEADNGRVLFNYGKSYLERMVGQPAAIQFMNPRYRYRLAYYHYPKV